GAVYADDRGVGKTLLQLLFTALCSKTYRLQATAVAGFAVLQGRALVVTGVAAKMRRGAVQRQARIEVGAAGYLAAIGTLYGRGKAAAIEKNQNLIACSNMVPDRFEAGVGQALLLLFGIKVDKVNGGFLSADRASRQAQMSVA